MPTRTPHYQEHYAFTLVELLAVVAIIGTLALLSMPSAKRAVESANQAKCLSNLRQIGVGANLYAIDHNNFYPSSWDQDTNLDFQEHLRPYLQQNKKDPRELYICPTAAKVRELIYQTYRGSYGFNIAITNGENSTPVPISRIGHPSRVILIADMCQAWPDGGDVSFWNPWWELFRYTDPTKLADTGPDTDELWTSMGWMRYRHNGGVNVVMVDGHSENLKKGMVTVGNFNPGL